MAVEVNPGQTLRHDGILYQAGEVIHQIEEDVKAELIQLGVIKDLEATAAQVHEQVAEDKQTVTGQVQQDQELVRGEVESSVHENAKADVEAALDTLAAPGEPVNQSSTPPATTQPTAAEVAATAAQVQ